MEKYRLAWFVALTCAVLLMCSAASARTVTLDIRPPAVAPAGPIVSIETETGETIEALSLEVSSVLVEPLVVTRLSIHLEPTAWGEVRVQVPKGAAVLHSDCGLNDDENTPPALVSGVWKKRVGFLFSSHLSLTYVQPLLNGRAAVVSAGGHPRLSRLEATLTDQQGHEIAEPLVRTDADARGDVVVEVSELAEAYRAGDLAMIDLTTHPTAVERIRDSIIAIDTSASSATAFRHVVERARALANAVQGRLSIVVFDQAPEVLYEGAAEGLPTSVFEKVVQRLDDIPTQYVPVKLQNPNYPLVPREVGTEAYLGEYRVVMQALAEKRTNDAASAARNLRKRLPNELATYLAWGSVAEARGDRTEARRAFGSLLDRFDDSARLHRVAAAWLSHLGDPSSRVLAVDALRSAIRLKDGRVETERQLAWLLAEKGDYEGALQLMTAAFLHQESRQPTLLNQEITILASALLAKEPSRHEAVMAQLKLSGASLAATPKLVFAMQNESERGLALSIYTDSKSGVRFKGTAYSYGNRDHPSAYEVSKEHRNAPYTLRVVDRGWTDTLQGQHTGLGYVRILDYDGRGHLHIEFRPFVLQQEGGEVDLATYG